MKTNNRVNLNPNNDILGIDFVFPAYLRNTRYGISESIKNGLGSTRAIDSRLRIEIFIGLVAKIQL